MLKANAHLVGLLRNVVTFTRFFTIFKQIKLQFCPVINENCTLARFSLLKASQVRHYVNRFRLLCHLNAQVVFLLLNSTTTFNLSH